jgi:hypothetical protein
MVGLIGGSVDSCFGVGGMDLGVGVGMVRWVSRWNGRLESVGFG